MRTTESSASMAGDVTQDNNERLRNIDLEDDVSLGSILGNEGKSHVFILRK